MFGIACCGSGPGEDLVLVRNPPFFFATAHENEAFSAWAESTPVTFHVFFSLLRQEGFVSLESQPGVFFLFLWCAGG